VRCALYSRVSTADQSVDLQLNDLRIYAERRGWEVLGEFTDHGVSGSRDRRPALDKMMAAAHERRVDAVVVWKIDRFGRSLFVIS
jgi:DNA invertase Pin-like site-specific DNA recombinase